MDCGPASLRCLLEGHGIPVSYGRLREACQTDVDGTSIDTLEEVATQLGLEAEQVMVPTDHVLLPEARCLPSLAVVTLPSGLTHFVVLWGTAGPLVQVMDPGTGRRWPAATALLSELYLHQMPVDAGEWRQWATTDDFTAPLARRLANLGLTPRRAEALIQRAAGAAGATPLGLLDAGARMVEALACGGGLRRGRDCARFLSATLERAGEHPEELDTLVPSSYWSAAPLDEEQVMLRGAVLVRVTGATPVKAASAAAPGAPADDAQAPSDEGLSPELVAALTEPPSRPGKDLWRMLRADGLLVPSLLMCALLLSSAGVVLEALVLRGVMDLGRELGLTAQRLGAVGLVLLFMGAMLALELPIASVLLRMGRRLETRMRAAFLAKIPRLGDRYFHSRLTSDMAERGHSIHAVRTLPGLGAQLLDGVFSLGLTTAALAWLNPPGALAAATVAGLSVALPLLAQPALAERDLRVRTHGGALSRFYLDALLGLVPIRTHGAERAVRREHESLLTEWARASLGLLRATVAVEGVLSLAGICMAAWLLFSYLGVMGGAAAGGPEGILLLVYWALRIPALGQAVAAAARQYPALRNVTLRLMEPLGAPEEAGDEAPSPGRSQGDAGQRGVELELDDVSVCLAGHMVLEGVQLRVAPGERLAVVGPSGAGKSTLAGLLLGWHGPSRGSVRVDGADLDAAGLEALRQETAWVDPAVHLWNRTLLDNLCYGNESAAPGTLVEGDRSLGRAMEAADLQGVLEGLPDGLQTRLGEGGALVSGGEGQRVRLGRGLLRRDARLVVLDEPFRGLDRGKRRALLAGALSWWSQATILCITHDVGETLEFDRVLVVDGGQVVEDGAPAELARLETSRYGALLREEQLVRDGLWQGAAWRRLRLKDGRLGEEVPS